MGIARDKKYKAKIASQREEIEYLSAENVILNKVLLELKKQSDARQKNAHFKTTESGIIVPNK